jgi:acetyltransferase-like isoleucine patch superfamily enzyme
MITLALQIFVKNILKFFNPKMDIFLFLNGIFSRIINLLLFFFFKRLDISFCGIPIIRGFRGHHKFGSGLKILSGCIFESFSNSSTIQIGDNCYLSYGVIIACSSKIRLGNNVWVGEYTSIRDSTHKFSIISPLGSLTDFVEPIEIGDNVWICRGSIILPGTVIGNNVIIGANSVVKGNIESNSLYAGSPARLLKKICF